jgi:hypothetical protein
VNNTLTEFEVISKSFIKMDTLGLQVRLVFKRILLFHLVNTYFPMLTLLIIVEITLFFDESQLQAAIALTLTVLLVMYTMYQGISAGVPKTAYLKLIDVWVFFCLLVPFIVFLIEFTWEVKKNKDEKKLIELLTTKTPQAWSNRNEYKKILPSKILHRNKVQIIFVFLTFTFVIAFFCLAVFSSNNIN